MWFFFFVVVRIVQTRRQRCGVKCTINKRRDGNGVPLQPRPLRHRSVLSVVLLVLVHRAQHELGDGVHVLVGDLAAVAVAVAVAAHDRSHDAGHAAAASADEHLHVRPRGAEAADQRHETGHGHGGHGPEHGDQGADQRDLQHPLERQRLQLADDEVERDAQQFFRRGDHLQQPGHAGLQETAAVRPHGRLRVHHRLVLSLVRDRVGGRDARLLLRARHRLAVRLLRDADGQRRGHGQSRDDDREPKCGEKKHA